MDNPFGTDDPAEMAKLAVWYTFQGLLFYFCSSFASRTWSRLFNSNKAGTKVKNGIDQLEPKKSAASCYFLWAFAGLFGIHHFYMGRILHGIMAAWTLNFCGLGWFADAVMIPFYVHGFNSRCHQKAPLDGTRWSLCIKLPGTIFSIVAIVFGSVLYLPWMIQFTGLVDIDRIAAQTQVNPYETLGLSRMASLAEAKVAYRKESLRWHPDRNLNCGKECEYKMHEITKAYEQVKKRKAPAPRDRTFQGMFVEAGKDWMALMESLGMVGFNG